MAPHIHTLLRARRDEIVREWEALACAGACDVPLDASALRDRLPELLDRLADWLEREEPARAASLCERASLHALRRLDRSCDLSQLLREYALLRATVLRGVLRAETPGQASAEEAPAQGGARDPGLDLARLNAGLDLAVSSAVAQLVGERDRRVEDLRRAEHQRRAAEERYARLVQLSPDAIVVHRDGRIAFANPAFLQLFGASSAPELVGRSPFDLVHPDDLPAVRAYDRRLLAGDAAAGPIEVRILRPDGTTRVVEGNARLFEDDDGKALEIVLRDVTEQRRAQEALRAADQRKTEFLAVLSHELRNCLAPITNGLRVLEDTAPGSAASRRTAEIVRRQLGHVTSLVDDLLDISRINAGKIRLRRTRLDARDVVRGVCEDVRAAFEERDVALRVDLGAEPLWVDADETRLTQVVANLLGNALKFTPSGAVDVSARRRGAALELRVRDTGVGIEPQSLGVIFEQFAQPERTRAASGGGMGIGLALVKSLVTMHGGTVHARSEGKGRGAELVVSLPLARAPAPDVARPSRSPIRALAILVVEDNRDAAETLGQLLELDGHRVRLAFDGRSGLDAWRQSPPDVVISDVGLPDVSGYELVRRMRADESGRSTFAIALTGYAQADDVERARDAGFDAHLAKPVAPERLGDLLAVAAAREGEEPLPSRARHVAADGSAAGAS